VNREKPVSRYTDGKNRYILREGSVLYRWLWFGKNKRSLQCYAVVVVKMGSFATSEENGGELADALFKLKAESVLELRCDSRLVLRSEVADERVDVDLRRHCNRSTGYFS